MKLLRPHALFRMGQAFRVLQRISPTSQFCFIKDEADAVESFLKEFNYRVSLGVFENTVKKVLVELSKSKSAKDMLSKDEIKKLSMQVMHSFEAIRVEAEQQKIYQIIEERYSSDKLLNEVDSLFAEKVFKELPEIAKYDFKEACSCILFERSTAAAFHLLRGTESVIGDLYMRLASVGATKPGNGTWGDFESALKALPNKPSDEFFEQSRHIRKNFRNPTQHPDKKYDIDEAQDLLNLCIDLSNRAIRNK